MSFTGEEKDEVTEACVSLNTGNVFYNNNKKEKPLQVTFMGKNESDSRGPEPPSGHMTEI